MVRLIVSVCAIAVVAAVVATSGAAQAETRLFTVRADHPGVTIVEAVRNGQPLAVAGQNAGATFFRIDNPAGAVPCFNRIQFTASNGATVDSPVNLCTSNWELTVAVGSGNGGGAGPGPSPGPGGGPPAGGSQPVAIVTDDPNLTITNVFLRGQEVPIAARQDPYVQINVFGGPGGFECTRDLGLALSDGRRIARLVDICRSNFLVVIALVGGPQPPPPPQGFRPPAVIQPLPQAPQVEVPPAPLPDRPEMVTGMQWMFAAMGNRASFAYGIPETDASEFTAVCQQRSSKVTITLTRTSSDLGPGNTVPVQFAAGAFAKSYTATGSPVSELDGVSHPVLQISTSDPLWSALIKESVLTIAIGSEPAYGLSLSGSAVQAKQFLVACSPPPPPPPPPPLPPQTLPSGPQGVTMGFACDDGSTINVAFDASTAVVYEAGEPPIVLLVTPYNGSQRWVAGLSQLVGQGEQIFWTRDGGYTRTCGRG